MERRLTERQQRIVELLAEGEDTEGVAEALGVGYYTARDLQRTLRETLGAPRVRDIPEYAGILARPEKRKGALRRNAP